MVMPQGTQGFLVPSASEKRKIPLYSGEYYGYCTVGGTLSCGLTHAAVTPLDVVKCEHSLQLDSPPPFSACFR